MIGRRVQVSNCNSFNSRVKIAAALLIGAGGCASTPDRPESELAMVAANIDQAQQAGAAEYTAAELAKMDRLAEFLSENPEHKLLIEGHTDSCGSDEFNRNLSEDRAQSVADALSQCGVSRDRLRTAGMGEAYPVASNDTSAGRQQNRRVEIVVSDGDGNFPDAAEQRAMTQ
jgi:outer membrane protein OmpA-like peptidoglycan-associated protein